MGLVRGCCEGSSAGFDEGQGSRVRLGCNTEALIIRIGFGGVYSTIIIIRNPQNPILIIIIKAPIVRVSGCGKSFPKVWGSPFAVCAIGSKSSMMDPLFSLCIDSALLGIRV